MTKNLVVLVFGLAAIGGFSYGYMASAEAREFEALASKYEQIGIQHEMRAVAAQREAEKLTIQLEEAIRRCADKD